MSVVSLVSVAYTGDVRAELWCVEVRNKQISLIRQGSRNVGIVVTWFPDTLIFGTQFELKQH